MDELDLIKKDWQERTKELPKYSREELMPMLHKKSSSSVKWIFIISVLEFTFWIVVELFAFSEDQNDMIENLGMTDFWTVTKYLNYIVLIIFIALFFINYKRIQIYNSAKQVMKQIIKTRKTVKIYVGYNIIGLAITFIITCLKFIEYQSELSEKELWIFAGIMTLFLVLIIGFFLLFYRIIYGIITRKLYKNYKILSKIEL
ncbi:hypothetical protein [Psychroflexus montanilacus]|uniref:hypothetical protein n=1 Tax=Psychroflexus montanilacus TaxID=2873598 RepID=UPI001CCE4B3D|nr:hypothetical protein [Psychroflexus montanilacus]MBZ9652955.1 hypothetical protein [Psychroflexus montanilacus]